MSTALSTMTGKPVSRLGMDARADLMNTLKNTVFKGENVTDEQFTALLIVANQCGLNPRIKETYAFPDKGGIVPIVSIDGWARIIDKHPQSDGMEFAYDKEEGACARKIYRKDRTHPTIVTEYMGECKHNTQPWQSHPARTLRHKTLIQCARLALGLAGIFDQGEAERVIEGSTTEVHIGHESDGRRPELIARGEFAARLGTVKYQEFWMVLSAEEKQVIGTVEKRRMYDMSLAVGNAEPVDAALPEDK